MSDDNDIKFPGLVKIISDNVIPINSQIEIVNHTLENFLALDIPDIEMIMFPWLPQKGITMIHSKRGVGKTFFCLSIAYAIASGKPFIGWQVPKPRKVLYIDGEMRAKDMQVRISSIARMFNCYETNDRFRIITPDLLDTPLNLYLLDHQGGINDLIEKEKIEVVIIDNISSLMYGFRENEADSWEPIQSWELLLRKMGVSVIRVMHTGKTDKVRATSKVEDVVDTTIYLKHPNDYDKSKQGARFIVDFEKNRGFYGEDAAPFEMHLKTNTDGSNYWHRQDAHLSTYNQVVNYLNEDYKSHEIADLIGISKGRVAQLKKKAEKEGRLIIRI